MSELARKSLRLRPQMGSVDVSTERQALARRERDMLYSSPSHDAGVVPAKLGAEGSHLEDVQALVLKRFLQAMTALLGVACVVFLPVLIRHDRLHQLWLALTLLVLLISFLRADWPHRIRARALLGVMCIGSAASVYSDGLAAQVALTGFALPFLGVLFLGRRAAIACFLWWCAVVGTFGTLEQLGLHRVVSDPTNLRMDPAHWPFLVLAQVVAGGPIVYAGQLLVRGLSAALSNAQTTLYELREAQATMAASERLKALGLLAGGIAHDLNNTLTVITCEVELARGLSEETRESILQAIDSAAHLATQVLHSAGKGIAQPRPLELQRALAPALTALRRVLPENIALEIRGAEGPLGVLGDAVLLQQALLNLAINARDAMPTGGRLVVELGRTRLDGKTWVEVTVRDTGEGMDETTLARATEPFFTTKAQGHGTGLGLANVRDTITKFGGELAIASKVGAGTSVSMRLPAIELARGAELGRAEVVNTGGGKVLIVEDNLRVRAIAHEALTQAGYDVLDAKDVAHAREMLAQLDHLDALVSDLTLPDGSGLDLARAVRRRFASAGILLVSGYAPSEADRAALQELEFPLLRKPFRASELVAEASKTIAR